MLKIILLILSSFAYADNFENEAKSLALDLKTSLTKNLAEKIKSDGVVKAIPFCHENVKVIAKESSGSRSDKFEFGRTSHKLRNEKNKPALWMEKYIEDFRLHKNKEFVIGKLEDGKKFYLEPLFIQAQCLSCHGGNISQSVSNEIAKLYPKDLATGFKLGDFRGVIWILQK